MRVALTLAPTKEIRHSLAHLCPDMDRKATNTLTSKYRCLPEEYYKGDPAISPGRLGAWFAAHAGDNQRGVRIWELCSGSSILSARARQRNISHLPPVDY